ncbi:MAG: cupredoxin family protein [Rhodocyclales bacterium]|nr:cupredoxin family protein [Rhodocyclales bacterium]
MKTTLTLIAISLLPTLALGGGNHGGQHHAMPGRSEKPGYMHDAPRGGGHAGNVGVPGNPDEVTRAVEVTMDDSMRFVPDSVVVKAGETIRFFARNTGTMTHEMVIGSMADLKAHAEMMHKFPGMEHEEPNMLTLKPGQRGGLVWKFDKPGKVDFACLIPGHMEVGMIAQVTVTE